MTKEIECNRRKMNTKCYINLKEVLQYTADSGEESLHHPKQYMEYKNKLFEKTY